MAGKVVVSTLNNDTGVLATQNGMTGIPKAWAQVASNGTINGSFNVSSVTRNSAGDYTVTYTTAMPNDNYAFNMNIIGAAARFVWSGTPATGSINIITANTSQTATDTAFSVSVFSS